MKCKQRLWMSNLSCGIVYSVPGSLTGSFCCLRYLLPLLFLPFMGTPMFTHTPFFPHLSYLFFLYSTLWISSTTIFYFQPFLFLSTNFYFCLAAHDSHSGYSYPAPSDSASSPPYCSSFSSPPPFISSGISTPFSRTLLFCSCLSTAISHNSLPLHSQFALWAHQQRLESSMSGFYLSCVHPSLVPTFPHPYLSFPAVIFSDRYSARSYFLLFFFFIQSLSPFIMESVWCCYWPAEPLISFTHLLIKLQEELSRIKAHTKPSLPQM